MRARRSSSYLRWASVSMILMSIALLTIQLIRFSRLRTNYPRNMVIANVPVGNLDREDTVERLLEIYSLPVELYYGDAAIHLNPALVDFRLNLESMLAAADLQVANSSFWTGFWDFLWGRETNAQSVPLDASYSENLLRSYLTHEIGGRYDQPPSIAKPIPGTVEFQVGTPGTSVSLDQAIILIENALFSSTNRTVSLPLGRTSPARPSLQNLQILLQQTIDLAGYDGLAGIYLQDMQTGQELHMLYSNGAVIPKTPDVSFTAASIIKIPIMVSVFRRMGENQDSEALKLLDEMITKSGNDPADWLMEQYVDPIRGPLEVTADMRALGLQSTFMTGLFRFGAPPLAVYNTPGNSRNDINTEPDIYNQTSVSEIGMLLADIYQCAETGGGALVAVFGNEITQRECQQMIELLANNFLPDLISGGVPDGIRVAHKHGWIQNNLGTINPIGDAGIVFTPSGNYVLVMYFYHPVEILYNPIAAIMRDLSRAIYNYYNLPSP